MKTRSIGAFWKALAALALTGVSMAAQALVLPQPPYQVDGFAMLYSSSSVYSATMAKFSRMEYPESEEAFQNLFLDALQPVMTVTGLEMSTLPVPFHNALREISLSPMTLEVANRREATFSNMILDVRSMTVYGDMSIKISGSLPANAPQNWYYPHAQEAIPLFKAFAGSTSTLTDYRSGESGVPWYPADAPFPMGYGPLGSGTPFISHSDQDGPDTAVIWLPNLSLSPEAMALVNSFSATPTAPTTSYGLNIGSMVIAVQASMVPEADTLTMAVVGLALMAGVQRRRRAA